MVLAVAVLGCAASWALCDLLGACAPSFHYKGQVCLIRGGHGLFKTEVAGHVGEREHDSRLDLS